MLYQIQQIMHDRVMHVPIYELAFFWGIGSRVGEACGGRWEGHSPPPREALREAGRAVELSRLSAAAEEAVQRFSREVLVVHPHVSRTAHTPAARARAQKARPRSD